MTVNHELAAARGGPPEKSNVTKSTPAKPTRAKYILNLDKIPQLSDAEKIRLREVTKKYAFRANDYYLGL
ncbi:MAG: hypothetical protein IH914_11215, partial [candidate division Zixibacteria bacterium]|nr:hypothetical protein [candidate division Zixibacteria bacterium]